VICARVYRPGANRRVALSALVLTPSSAAPGVYLHVILSALVLTLSSAAPAPASPHGLITPCSPVVSDWVPATPHTCCPHAKRSSSLHAGALVTPTASSPSSSIPGLQVIIQNSVNSLPMLSECVHTKCHNGKKRTVSPCFQVARLLYIPCDVSLIFSIAVSLPETVAWDADPLEGVCT
jgi:hypothetical protein